MSGMAPNDDASTLEAALQWGDNSYHGGNYWSFALWYSPFELMRRSIYITRLGIFQVEALEYRLILTISLLETQLPSPSTTFPITTLGLPLVRAFPSYVSFLLTLSRRNFCEVGQVGLLSQEDQHSLSSGIRSARLDRS